jgi:hypothetical protein
MANRSRSTSGFAPGDADDPRQSARVQSWWKHEVEALIERGRRERRGYFG